MSSIEELQQRVVQAEERFGLINAERAKYSERLMGLIDAIETRLGDQQTEIERQAGESASQAEELDILRRDSGENKLLRGMLQSLLNAIELGNGVALSETMQVLDTKISALIDESNAAETAPSEPEVPEPEPELQEIEAAEVEFPEAEPAEAESPEAEPAEAESPEVELAETEAEAPELEAVEPLEEESAAPELEAIEDADTQPEEVMGGAEVETAEAGPPELDAVEVTEAEDPAPETIPEENAEVAGETVAAEETQAAPESVSEPEPEAETAAPVVLEIPASDTDVTMIDEEMVIGAAGEEAPPVADAVEENLVDEAGAVLDIPAAADAGEQKPEASSLEDIMRRVSKLVEDEGALGPLATGGVQVDPSEPSPEAPSPEPAEEKSSATGG